MLRQKLRTLWQILRLRDLRGTWVLPRLAYSVSGHATDRAVHMSLAFFVLRPARRVSEFFRTLADYQTSSEIALAGFAVLIAFVRALAFLVFALAAAVLVISSL